VPTGVDDVVVMRSVDVPEASAVTRTLVGLRVMLGPLSRLGSTLGTSETVPLNPFRLSTKMVPVALLPWVICKRAGPLIAKSGLAKRPAPAARPEVTESMNVRSRTRERTFIAFFKNSTRELREGKADSIVQRLAGFLESTRVFLFSKFEHSLYPRSDPFGRSKQAPRLSDGAKTVKHRYKASFVRLGLRFCDDRQIRTPHTSSSYKYPVSCGAILDIRTDGGMCMKSNCVPWSAVEDALDTNKPVELRRHLRCSL
jgi:hypothetical protein